MAENNLYIVSDLVSKLTKEKEVGRKYQERRHEEWNDNYELNRNKVQTNRLTQRQTVTIPLMKETNKTLLSKIDDPPEIEWKELLGNTEKEIVLQERWNYDYDRLSLESIDIQDKKTVLLYGRSFKKLNFINGEFICEPLDIYDVVVDPYTNPLNIETARFLIHQNIFKTASEIVNDERYSEAARNEFTKYLNSQEAILQSGDNKIENDKKNERLKAMGVTEVDFNKFAASDLIVNLCEHYKKEWNKTTKKYYWKVYIYANNSAMLLEETLEDLLGIDFLPFITWADDTETQDFWSDGVDDLVRVPNKIVNIWFSQMVENRTLKNFQMHWYDATKEGYTPQTYEPGAGKMLPAPGNPKETILPVEISGLEDTMTMIDFIVKLVERGTSATAIEKGVGEKKQTTLGEIQILVGKAAERSLAMAKFYRRAWQEYAMKWYKIIEANEPETERTFYKTSSKGNLWAKTVKYSEWKSEKGYKAIAKSSSEQEQEDTKSIQKWIFIKGQFPNNLALIKIAQKRMLGIVNLTADEIREVEEFEKKQQELAQSQPLAQNQPQTQTNPEVAQLNQRMGEMQKALQPS